MLSHRFDNNYFEIVELLLDDGRVDPSELNQECLRHAAENGHLWVVDLLLQDWRVEPDAIQNFAIRLACLNGHSEIVNLLMSYDRVDPGVKDNYCIQWASANGHTKVVKMLLLDKSGRVDPSSNNNYCIKKACFFGHFAIVKILIRQPSVNPCDSDNYSIRIACEKGYLRIAKLLFTNRNVIIPKVKNNYSLEILNLFKEILIQRSGWQRPNVSQSIEKRHIFRTSQRTTPCVSDNEEEDDDENQQCIPKSNSTASLSLLLALKENSPKQSPKCHRRRATTSPRSFFTKGSGKNNRFSFITKKSNYVPPLTEVIKTNIPTKSTSPTIQMLELDDKNVGNGSPRGIAPLPLSKFGFNF